MLRRLRMYYCDFFEGVFVLTILAIMILTLIWKIVQ